MEIVLLRRYALAFGVLLAFQSSNAAEEESPTGTPVAFQLPAGGQIPKTYRVTLAVTDPEDPDWIIGTFVAGQPFTVTKDNGGKFTAYWDGLDDNYMPLPPGEYGLKGIYMPAELWEVTGKYQTLIPEFKLGISSWMQTQENPLAPYRVRGHGMWTFNDIAVTPDGKALVNHNYMENGYNLVMLDLKKPIGYDQVYKNFRHSGGKLVAHDGKTVWLVRGFLEALREKGGFGRDVADRGRARNVTIPGGAVTDMQVLSAGKVPYLYTTQDVVLNKVSKNDKQKFRLRRGKEPFDKVVVYHGNSAKVMAELAIHLPRALSLVPERNELYVLHRTAEGQWAVSRGALKDGLPAGELTRLFVLTEEGEPQDIVADHDGNIYICWPMRNAVNRYGPAGSLIKAFARIPKQVSGTYNPYGFMYPCSLARWKDPEGKARILVLEMTGANRMSEWTADGELIRQWIPEQSDSVKGSVAVDPEIPQHIYNHSSSPERGGINRFKADYEKGTWELDAVWPDIGRQTFPGGGARFRVFHTGGHKYLAFSRSDFIIYRQQGKDWLPAAAIYASPGDDNRKALMRGYLWTDANGDGAVQEEEYKGNPVKIPEGIGLRWHGEDWLEDLSLILQSRDGTKAWRLKPRAFNEHGNPVYSGDDWQVLLDDPIAKLRQEKKDTPARGGNELPMGGSSWSFVDGDDKQGFWWKQTSGKGFSANVPYQVKLNYFAPDGKGGFRLKYRVGRADFGYGHGDAMLGPMHVYKPTYGLVGISDASTATYHVFSEDGLYVDSVFPRYGGKGVYAQPGEHFHNGFHFLDPETGKIYISIGKVTPHFFGISNWQPGLVKRLALPKTVTLLANRIATPPEKALTIRGGAGKAYLARFYPAMGGVALDGSLDGWLDATPLVLAKGKDQKVVVRCKYDPDTLYLHMRAKLGRDFSPGDLGDPQRLFTHDRESDTVSFYYQGDDKAVPPSGRDGRPGDVRFVFGLFKDQDHIRPVALGMYTKSLGGQGRPATYKSPVGQVDFEDVGLVSEIQLGYALAEDGKGFTIVAAIPRKVLPGMANRTFGEAMRTMVDFEATFGHSKFWWADSDNKASTETYDEPSEAALYPGSWAPAEWIAAKEGIRRVNTWLIAGPFKGVDGIDKRDPKSVREGVQKMHKLRFPPDEWPVDYETPFPKTMMNKKIPNQWRLRRMEQDKNETVLTWAFQMVYASCWVHVPRDVKMQACFWHANQSYNTIKLNGQPVKLPRWQSKQAPKLTFELKKGWNNIWFRGFTHGRPLRIGIDFLPPEDLMWTMKITATPQPIGVTDGEEK